MTSKHFGFCNSYSTKHAIIKSVDKPSSEFERSRCRLGIFFDLSKAFETINHQIPLKKINLFSITGINYFWMENYLTNRKQCVVINNNENTKFQDIICGEHEWSFFDPLVFIWNINDLKNVSNALYPFSFADDTNL